MTILENKNTSSIISIFSFFLFCFRTWHGDQNLRTCKTPEEQTKKRQKRNKHAEAKWKNTNNEKRNGKTHNNHPHRNANAFGFAFLLLLLFLSLYSFVLHPLDFSFVLLRLIMLLFLLSAKSGADYVLFLLIYFIQCVLF